MAEEKTSKDQGQPTKSRVCRNCAMIVDEPVERCPRCDALMESEREDNIADKASADSFPASDPPAH